MPFERYQYFIEIIKLIEEAGKNQLKKLDLSGSALKDRRLTQIPDEVFELKHLDVLDLSHNQLTTVPASIANLQYLTYLDLRNNQLTTIPESIAKLQNLTELNLGGNQLTNFPESIAKLQNLTSLDLSSNRLTTVPESIAKLQNLAILRLEDNPIETPPTEVLRMGVNAIKNYFRQMQVEGKDYLYEAKLLIVGEAGAGKTTLAKKIEDNDYVLKDDEPSTEGIDVIKWEFPLPGNKNFRVNIWDYGFLLLAQRGGTTQRKLAAADHQK